MMATRRRFLDKPQTSVDLDAFRGLRLMSRSRASQVHAAADRVLAHGRRILCRTGLNGASEFRAVDTVATSTRTKPLRTTEVVVARTPPISLTPGHFLRMMFVALPSGETETTNVDVNGDYIVDGASGSVKVEVTFDNGVDTETITKEISIEGSKIENGAQPSTPGSGWAALRRFRTDIFPADFKNAVNLSEWCDGTTVEIVVSYIGSPRVVDLCVHEQPFGLAYDISTTGWAAPMHSSASGGDLGTLPGPFPVTQFSGSDAGGGTIALLGAAKRLCQEFGPVVWYWSAWCESVQNVTDTEAAPVTKNSVLPSLAMLTANGTSGYGTAARQFQSVSACVNASRVQDSEATVVLRGKEHVVPVRFYAYAKMSVGGVTGEVKFECDATRTHTRLTIAAGTSYAWHSVRGYIRCSVGPEQFVGLFTRVGVSSAATCSVLYIMIVYDPT